MKAILALDQGTTSSRALIFDHAGSILASAQQEFTQHFPKPGWVEHDADEIWRTQEKVALDAIAKSGLVATDIGAIGITNQRETTVLWDRQTGHPLAPAIVWQDRRTAPTCEALTKSLHAEGVAEKTGLIIDAYFSATKIAWLLDHVPHARARAARGELACGTIDSWLIWKLTGGKVHATDVSNASRTMLFNIHTLQWDEYLLALFNVPRTVLPEIVSSSGLIGNAASSNALNGLPIAGVAGDQQAALFGQGCHRAGLAKNTYGTGCFMLMNTGIKPMRSQHRLLTTVAWRIGSTTSYALEGSVFAAGAAVQWLRDGLGMISNANEIEALAASVPDSGGVVMVPAFAGLGAPHWNANARATLQGLTRGSTKAHVARAALEAIAFQSAELAHAMNQDAGLALAELRVDGGASVNNLLMQIQADVLGVPVVRPRITETTALGAAYLAGLAVGFWQSQAEIAAQWQRERTFSPATTSEQTAKVMATWQRAVARSKDWVQE